MPIRIVCLADKDAKEKILDAVDKVAENNGFSVIEERFTHEDYLLMIGFLGLLAQGHEDKDEDDSELD